MKYKYNCERHDEQFPFWTIGWHDKKTEQVVTNYSMNPSNDKSMLVTSPRSKCWTCWKIGLVTNMDLSVTACSFFLSYHPVVKNETVRRDTCD